MADYSIVGVAERDLQPTRAAAVLPMRIERKIDLAAIALASGTPLASGDVVQIMRIPHRSVIKGAYVSVDTVLSDAAATIDVDTASGESLIAAAAVGGADAGDVVAAATPAPVITNTDTDFIEVTLTGITANATGVFRVALEIMDLEGIRTSGIAQLGS